MGASEQIKKHIKRAIVSTKMLRYAARYAPPGVAILRYHSVNEEPQAYENTIGIGIIHSAKSFNQQMEILAKHFNVVSLDEVHNYLRGEGTLPKKSVAVTFDDGFEDNYTIAAPILNKYEIPATVYVVTGAVENKKIPWYMRLRYAFSLTTKNTWINENGILYNLNSKVQKERAFIKACEQCAVLAGDLQEKIVGKIEETLDVEPYSGPSNLMLKWSQIQALHDQGHIIGSHTLSHPNMAYINDEDLKTELKVSKNLLEKKLGITVRHFGYPSPVLQPHWTEHTKNVTKQVGYETAVTCTSGKVTYGDDPLSLKRIWAPFNKEEFLWYIENTLLGRTL